jgi:hypothetical protein
MGIQKGHIIMPLSSVVQVEQIVKQLLVINEKSTRLIGTRPICMPGKLVSKERHSIARLPEQDGKKGI